jgi:hypothetical protein
MSPLEYAIEPPSHLSLPVIIIIKESIQYSFMSKQVMRIVIHHAATSSGSSCSRPHADTAYNCIGDNNKVLDDCVSINAALSALMNLGMLGNIVGFDTCFMSHCLFCITTELCHGTIDIAAAFVEYCLTCLVVY